MDLRVPLSLYVKERPVQGLDLPAIRDHVRLGAGAARERARLLDLLIAKDLAAEEDVHGPDADGMGQPASDAPADFNVRAVGIEPQRQDARGLVPLERRDRNEKHLALAESGLQLGALPGDARFRLAPRAAEVPVHAEPGVPEHPRVRCQISAGPGAVLQVDGDLAEPVFKDDLPADFPDADFRHWPLPFTLRLVVSLWTPDGAIRTQGMMPDTA